MKKVFFVYLFLFVSFYSFAQFENKYYYHACCLKEDSLLKIVNSYKTDKPKSITPFFFVNNPNVTKQLKDSLFSVIKKGWSDKIIDSLVNVRKEKYFEGAYFYRILNKSDTITRTVFAERYNYYNFLHLKDSSKSMFKSFRYLSDSIVKVCYDSFTIIAKNEWGRECQRMALKVDDGLLLGAAVCGVDNIIPMLKEALHDSVSPRIDIETAKLALAIYGDTVCQQYFFNVHKQYIKKKFWFSRDLENDKRAMFLINTQKSIEMLADWFDTTKRFSPYLEGYGHNLDDTYYFPALIVSDILRLIKNKQTQEIFMKLPEEMADLRGDTIKYYNVSLQQILFLKRWMLDNKGKFDLPPSW